MPRTPCRHCGELVHGISAHGRASRGTAAYHAKLMRDSERNDLLLTIAGDRTYGIRRIAAHVTTIGREIRL